MTMQMNPALDDLELQESPTLDDLELHASPAMGDFEHAESPDWSTRPWGRPSLRFAVSDNPSFLAVCDFRYHGLRIRGVRVYKWEGNLAISMPRKRYGDVFDQVVYFAEPAEREQFTRDVLWVYNTTLGRRRQQPPVASP